jgi:serine protease Do
MAYLEELAAVIVAVAERATPAVVGLGGRWRAGSGIVIAGGQLLTNAHNVGDGTTLVTFSDGRQAEASLKGLDIDGDLAVLEVDTGDSQPLEMSEAPPAVGAPVFGLSADGGSGVRVTFGTISAISAAFRGPRGRRISGAIEHTAPLAPGSSGGPLVDAAARLVGLNTNRLGGGFYLALPAGDALASRVAALGRGETVETPRLGIGIAPARAARRLRRAVGLPERDGVLVRLVEEGSPAEKSGLAVGDLIIAAGGQPITDAEDLYMALSTATGRPLELQIVRGTEERAVSISF